MAPEHEESGSQEVDAALESWRQGDCVLGEDWFVHRFDPTAPLTPESESIDLDGGTLVESPVAGLVVLTQTCDIVRSCFGPNARPFIEVAPLVAVDEEIFRQVRHGWRPGYAYIPAIAELRLVADLDRTMTLEKGVVAKWQQTQGCDSDEDRRKFAQALARKRARAAFPDDFTKLAEKLHKRLKEKHDRQSPEGRALRSLREIRVKAAPSWGATKVSIFFWFIKDDSSVCPDESSWDTLCSRWLELVKPAGRFNEVEGLVADLEGIPASEYVDSDQLDLDHLSSRPAD